MKRKLHLKVISLILTLTLLVGIVTPTIASAEDIKNNKSVNVSAISDTLLNVLSTNNKEHIKQLEITDIEFNMERDFDQSGYVTVKNTGAKDVEFLLDITNDYDDIFLGFVGAGSPNQPTLITAGSSVKVKLTVFAQKVGKNKYNLPVKSYVVEGDNYILDTETEIVINFKDTALNFACDLISTNTDTLEQNFMLTNMGEDLNCVSITADSDLAEYVTLNPTVSDVPVKKGESLNITVTPNYTALKNNNVSLVRGNLVVNAVGKQQSFAVTVDTQGKEIHSITMRELTAYQKGHKEYYNLIFDTSALADTVKFTNNSSPDNIDYKVDFSVPYIDKNTNKEITRLESSYTVENYNDSSLKTGDMLVNKFYQEGDNLIYEYKMFVKIEDLKEFIATLDEDFYNVFNQYKNLDKVESKLNAVPSEKAIDIAKQSFNYWEDVNGTWGADITAVLIGGIHTVGSVLGNIYTIAGGLKGGYDWATDANHEHEEMIWQSPNLTDREKEEYSHLCDQQDQKGVGVPVTGIVAGMAFSGGVGIAVGLSIVFIDHLDRDRMAKRKAELEAKAGIGDGEGGDGGQITTDNKRNQCTNAGRIEGDFNNPFGLFSGMGGSTGGGNTGGGNTGGGNTGGGNTGGGNAGGGGNTDSTEVPTNVTSPTDPTLPILPVLPTSPTSPTSPTDVPTDNGNPSLGQNNSLMLIADKKTVNPRETVKIWTATKGTKSESDNLEYKLQYKTENYPLWSDYNGYTDYPVWHISFNDANTYDVRCLIRFKDTKQVSYTATEQVYVTDTCLNGYFNRKAPSIFVTSRLAAGDEAANDDNMTTTYLINGTSAGTITNNGHAQLTMAVVNATSDNIKTGTNTITALYSTTPTHYRTVSDMQIITYYPADTVVNYIGDLEYYPDTTLRPDFTIFEENIYTDSKFYVNEETTLHCNIYNRNASGGWVDIVVKDGDEVIYSETNTWMGMFSEKILDIPWTPKARENAITVELINKCTSVKEADLTNNKAERNMKAYEYIEPKFGETGNSIALENREFSVYTHTLDYQNVTKVACYIDDKELKLSYANTYNQGIKYWTNIKGLSAGNHQLKYVITYDMAGNVTGTLEKIVDINVISKKNSSTVIEKNPNNNNTSAVVYRDNSIYSTHKPTADGTITIMYNSDMYDNRSAYKLAVYTEKGVYVTSLTAGNIQVDNSKVQNTFKVAVDFYSIRFANLYIKNNNSNYSQQLSYKTLKNKNEVVFYLSDENYALYNNCNNAYMVLVTTGDVVYKLQLIDNSKRVATTANAIKLNASNLYSPTASASNNKSIVSASNAISQAVSTANNGYGLISKWAYAYSNVATMNIQKLGTALTEKNINSNSTLKLSADTYDVYYNLMSDNCIFDIYKEISISDSNVTNEIDNIFAGEVVATNNEVYEGENVNLSISKLLDKNGNELTGISSLKNEFSVTVTFTDVNDSNNVCIREITTRNLQNVLENVKSPEKFGKYKIALNVTINTYSNLKVGDVDSDGKAGIRDVIIMMRFMLSIGDPFTDLQTKAADIDMSNTFTLKDIVLLQRNILGIK